MTKTTDTQASVSTNGHDETKGKPVSIGVRLQPVSNADQPIVANHTALHPTSGMVLIDFGFIEPELLATLPRLAKQGKKLPDAMEGKLVTRVALGPDALTGLHRQLSQLLAGSKKAAAKSGK